MVNDKARQVEFQAVFKSSNARHFMPHVNEACTLSAEKMGFHEAAVMV
jgi:hypothetical protein